MHLILRKTEETFFLESVFTKMEYKTELCNSNFIGKVVITPRNINIEVNEINTGNNLVWNNLNSFSLFKIQMLYNICCDIPYKLAAAININQKENIEENGYHCLVSAVTLIKGLCKNDTDATDVCIQELKNDIDDIGATLKNRLTNSAVQKSKILCTKLQTTKLACHIYLYFAFGEFFAVQTSGKDYSALNTELWKHAFNYIPCTIPMSSFTIMLEKNLFIDNGSKR